MATRRAPRLPDPVEAALDALARALRTSAAAGRDAQRVQAAVRKRVAALTAAPAGQLAAADLARALRVLDISMSEAGRLFGVSRSAVEQWLQRGVPPARLARAANLARIADILERNLKPERIAAVVREPAGCLRRARRSSSSCARAATTTPASCSSRRSTGRARPDAPRRARRELSARGRPGLGDPLDASFSRRSGGRWNPPGAFAALYLCRDVETARANARRLLEGQPFTFDDLLPERLPALVETTVPEARYVDAVTARGLASLGSPGHVPARRARPSGRPRALPADRQRRLGGRRAGHRVPQRRPRRAARRRGARPLRPRRGACGAAAASASSAGTGSADWHDRGRTQSCGPTLVCAMQAAFGILAGILQLVATRAVPARHHARHDPAAAGDAGRSGRRSRSSCSPRSGRAGRRGAFVLTIGQGVVVRRHLRARPAARRRRHEPRSSSSLLGIAGARHRRLAGRRRPDGRDLLGRRRRPHRRRR